ncbi:hypothetical protein [Kitasatospora viridis]|uniref:Uncharacterized protein n=1 Tax=Kitasatospora viridis TaxID=281105 RepID=A0A561UFA4_9ACTN|nr:hypothetical protein [Kitasatospora viridis]TWF98057.1 hypothetical protein FHX73_111860 [Kitasatospora viridis]
MDGQDPREAALGRRRAADPVRELMEAHRVLCERAVDPLEIAAGLEEAGIGAAVAGRYRHADVFGLAEELFARVPRRPVEPPAPLTARPAPGWRYRLGSGAGLLGALLLPLLTAAPGALGTALALALAAWPAAGAADRAARWVRHTGKVQVRGSVTLAEFRARMRPVLPVALGLHLAVLALTSFAALAVLTVLAPRPGSAALGLLPAVVQRACPAQWYGQAVLGLLVGAAAVLRRLGRARLALAGVAVADAVGLVLALVRPAAWSAVPGTLTVLAAGAAAAVLLPPAWAATGQATSYS